MGTNKSVRLILALLITAACAFLDSTAAALPLRERVNHKLEISINPADHSLAGIDRLIVTEPKEAELVFRLSPRAALQEVRVNGAPRRTLFESALLRVPLMPHEAEDAVHIEIRYRGIFNDPVPIQPLNTDNPGFGVNATISERGCFLLAGAAWYPELIDAAATYDLKISGPKGWLAVTSGRLKSHHSEDGRSVSEWAVDDPAGGLALSMGRFTLRTKRAGDFTAATYFLSDDPDLAQVYLDATLKYLQFYSDLFGPYAFEQFAVVENFFPTGYGFPSFTLLGARVLRLPFIVRTSLPHEIAHCWWGNGVRVDARDGNWSEGLTTYVADYLLKEKQSAADAHAYRRRVLRSYSTLVPLESDFPLGQFTHRWNPLTRAVGYDKGAMVFHMLRRLIGDEAFWRGLRDIYRQHIFDAISWAQLQAAFERSAGRSLQIFFDQWVLKAGAPQFRLTHVISHPSTASGPWRISGQIRQDGKPFAFPLEIELETASGAMHQIVQVTGSETQFGLTSPSAPLRLRADPHFHLLRRLYPQEIAPTVNSLKGASRVVVFVSDSATHTRKLARILVKSLGVVEYLDPMVLHPANAFNPPPDNLLLVGRPPMTGEIGKILSRVVDRDGTVQMDGVSYDRPGDVFFSVFDHPAAPERVIALFWPLTGQSAEIAARKITHYGNYSYLIFRNGRNALKGVWPVSNSPLERRW